MSIFKEVSKHAAYISLKLGKLKKNTPEYAATQSTKDAILALGKELAVTNGTNSPVPSEKLYKSRPIPSCSATHSADQSITDSTLTYLAFDTVLWDDLENENDKAARFHSGTVENTKFFVHKEGKYDISAFVGYEGGALTDLPALCSISLIRTDKNGTNTVLAQTNSYEVVTNGVTYGSRMSCFAHVYLFPGDYIRVGTYQDNANNVARNVENNFTSGGLTYYLPNFYITGPFGGPKDEDLTTRFRPSSNAIPNTGEGGGSSVITGTTPQCRVYNSANITIPNNALTALTFNSERYDTGAMHSTAVNTGRITIVTAGKYLVGACVQFDATTATALQCRIRLNGTTVITMVTDDGGTGADQKRLNPSCVYDFSAGDYIEVVVYQNSGANLNVSTFENASPEFWATLQPGAYVI